VRANTKRKTEITKIAFFILITNGTNRLKILFLCAPTLNGKRKPQKYLFYFMRDVTLARARVRDRDAHRTEARPRVVRSSRLVVVSSRAGMRTNADERASIARVAVFKYGAIPEESAAGVRAAGVSSRRSRAVRGFFGALLAACVAVLGFCQFFTDVSAAHVVSSVGAVGAGYARYYAATTRLGVEKFFSRSTASAASLGESEEIQYFEGATGNASATLGGCGISSSSPPANCAVPQVAVRSCSYQGTCSTVPACALGYVPSGSKGTCATHSICTPRICAPTFCCSTAIRCRRWRCRTVCKRHCGGGCTGGDCANVPYKWSFTCTKAATVTTGKCDACAPFFVARDSSTKCIVDPALTAAYDSTVGAINNAKSAVTTTINDINTVINDLTTAIPNKANEIASKIEDISKSIPDAVNKVVSQLISEAFPADADKFLSQIMGVLKTASLGASSTEAGSRVVNSKNDHFSTVLAHGRVRAMIRDALGREKTHIPSEEQAADLGGKCGTPELSISLPLDDILPASVVDLSYDMPWPKKLGDSPFAPATLTAGFPDPSWTMGFEISEFSFPKKVATGILDAFMAFFKPLFQSIGDGVLVAADEVTDSMMSPIDALKSSVNAAKDTANTVKSKLNSVTQSLSGRKLLSDEMETHAEHLRAVHAATSAHLTYAENVHDQFLDRVEHLVLLQVAKVRTALLEDPWLEKPDTISQFPHMHAQLGDAVLQEAADAAKQELIDAMQALKDFTMKAVLFTRLHVEFAVEAQASAFKSGNVLDLVKGLPTSASFEVELPVPYTPFTMKMSLGADLSLPYFLQAEAKGEFSYSVDVTGMEVGIQVADGTFNAVLPDPKVELTPYLNAQLRAHAQVGLVVTVNDITTQLCMPGMVCSGPKMTAEQRMYAGADMAATVNNQGTQACSALSAKFNDNFEYDDAYRSKRCSSASFGGVECSVVVGAYFQIPKTDIDVVLKTDVDIGGVSICVPDVQLYTFPGSTNNPNFLLELA
jgi:hypothetical protein